ncbi:hypothetical protein PHLGIDRAFT_124547 [Phlebiopsis gigantea 11061_1 CR5-6]|uniref:Glycoside hydrolase family 76 protein n=1 Tax=Phlebiopsis gigantea (strain 11061_1 CR5-6) TaxID=745531 RepID=A0A0C3SDJ8_PHLG1|nr:hypothetical protein PHLGIDRAFT_124547 [Phlebiopsis gigantea 11061_1 CR5-6]
MSETQPAVLSFSVPASWRSPTSNASLDSRISLAKDVIQFLTPLFNPATGTITSDTNIFFSTSGSILTAMALSDLHSGLRTYGSLVLRNVQTVIDHQLLGAPIPANTVSGMLQVGDISVWGLAAVAAHRAYGNVTMLDLAISTWELASRFMIQLADASSGTQATRDVFFSSSCNGVAGGVFFLGARGNDTKVSGESTGSFASLSAHLSVLTLNATYTSAAQLASRFIQSQLYDGTAVQNSITLSDCSRSSDPSQLQADESGFFIEALSVLSRQDPSWLPLLYNILSTTIPNTLWTMSNGINFESTRGSAQTTPLFFRGLYNAWHTTVENQTSLSQDVAKYVDGYMNVQFNALQDLASLPGSDEYSTSWTGPPPLTANSLGQYYAVEIFNAEIAMASNQSVGSGTSNMTIAPGTARSTPTGAQITSPNNTSRLGAILGGILDGIALLVGGLIYLLLRSKGKSNSERRTLHQLDTTAVPFTESPRATSVATPGADKRLERPQITIPSASSAPELSSNATPSDVAIGSTNQQRSRSTDDVVSPSTASTGLSSPGVIDLASMGGVYNLLATLIARMQPAATPGEQPPGYEDGLVQV